MGTFGYMTYRARSRVSGAKVWQQPSLCRSLTRSIRPWQHLGRCIPELKVFLCFLCSPIFCIQRYSKYFKVKYSGKIQHRSPLRRLYIYLCLYSLYIYNLKKNITFPKHVLSSSIYHVLQILDIFRGIPVIPVIPKIPKPIGQSAVGRAFGLGDLPGPVELSGRAKRMLRLRAMKRFRKAVESCWKKWIYSGYKMI